MRGLSGALGLLGLGEICAFGALTFRGRIITGKYLAAPTRKVKRVVCAGVQECPVVRDKDNGALKVAQPGFEPHDGFQVEMVSRLIQQQQITGGHERPGQVQAYAPAAGEFRIGLFKLIGRKTEARKNGRCAGRRRVTIQVIECAVQESEFVAVAGAF